MAHDLDLSDQTTYNWRRQDRVDRGLQAGLSTTESGELAKAKRRIAELETELAVSRRAVELGPGRVPCRRRPAITTSTARAPSERFIRHTMLTDLIAQIHLESHQIYGARRVHAELTWAVASSWDTTRSSC